METQKTILVTGASRGIGYDTVLELAKNPNNQIFALSRNKPKLEALQKLCTNNNVQIIPFDLVAFDADNLIKALKGISSIDALINNAGLLVNEPFDSLSIKNWRTIFEVNLFGVVQLVQALLPQLSTANKAHIVNIGSMGGVQGSSKFPGLSAYSASKAAIANLTECLAEELKDKNISVNCLALGAIQTEMLAEAFPGYEAPVTSKAMAAYLAEFALNGHQFHNGKIIPVAVSTP